LKVEQSYLDDFWRQQAADARFNGIQGPTTESANLILVI
jgi:hypothetical protein